MRARTIDKESRKKGLEFNRSTLWLVIGFSLIISLFILVVYVPPALNSVEYFFNVVTANFITSIFYFVLLWGLSAILYKKLPWDERTILRLIVQLVGISLIVLLLHTLGNYTVLKISGNFTIENFKSGLTLQDYVNAHYIPIIISMFFESRGLLKSYKDSIEKIERQKYNTLQAQHAYLRAQIKPHFLFNSLNVLSTLVHKNPDTADRFVQELARLYRRLLEVNQQELVSLHDELDALRSYIFLVKIRFADAIKIEINEPPVSNFQYCLPPFSLQLLLENAIKHNMMSRQNPLNINLYYEDDYLVVQNNVRERQMTVEGSTGVGLKNLKERFEMISDLPVEIVHDDEQFLVRIPLLHQESIDEFQEKHQLTEQL